VSPVITSRPADGIAEITLNRPEAMNSISSAMAAELARACAELAAAPEVRVVVFGAAGERAFCAGADLKERAGMTDADVARIIAGPDSGGGDPLETALLRATDELYRDDRVSDDTWAALSKGLDTRQLLDVLVAVGGYRSTSMAINSAGVQLDPNMADFRFPPSLR